jgi:hypothetical protein
VFNLSCVATILTKLVSLASTQGGLCDLYAASRDTIKVIIGRSLKPRLTSLDDTAHSSRKVAFALTHA